MLKKLDVKEFDEMFSIMEKSFPTDEYRPYEEQKSLLDNKYYTAYVYNDGKLKGFIAVWDFYEFLYIEHFAVNPDFRNQGIGAQILKEISLLFNKPLCLEVEPPENSTTKRRVGFYERNGFCLNEYPYIQPPISKGKNPVPLMIMSSGSFLSVEEFNKVKNTLYKEVYKINGGDIPEK